MSNIKTKISARELAKRKGVTRDTIYKWIKLGKIPESAIVIEQKNVIKIDTSLL